VAVAEGGVDDEYSRYLAEADAHAAADAMAAATAVYAGVGLADRLRDAIGVGVAIRTTAGEEALAGTVAEVASGGVAVIDRSTASLWVIMLGAVESISGVTPGHRLAADPVERRRSTGALLRGAAGSLVTIGLPGRRISGRLDRVGADHLQVNEASVPLLLPFTAMAWVRVPLDLPGA
jgi:hypothetical protein